MLSKIQSSGQQQGWVGVDGGLDPSRGFHHYSWTHRSSLQRLRVPFSHLLGVLSGCLHGQFADKSCYGERPGRSLRESFHPLHFRTTIKSKAVTLGAHLSYPAGMWRPHLCLTTCLADPAPGPQTELSSLTCLIMMDLPGDRWSVAGPVIISSSDLALTHWLNFLAPCQGGHCPCLPCRHPWLAALTTTQCEKRASWATWLWNNC